MANVMVRTNRNSGQMDVNRIFSSPSLSLQVLGVPSFNSDVQTEEFPPPAPPLPHALCSVLVPWRTLKEPWKTESEVNIWESGWWCRKAVLSFQPRRKYRRMCEKSDKYSTKTKRGKKSKQTKQPTQTTDKQGANKNTEEGVWNLKGSKSDLARDINYDSLFLEKETKQYL